MNRALFTVLLLTAVAIAQQPAKPAPKPDTTQWVDALDLTIEGKAWSDTAAPYDRLPARAEKTVPKSVWNLSRDSAGMAVRFVADTSELRVRWSLRKAKLEMTHMAATGVSGCDLYARDDSGQWRWINVTRPAAQEGTGVLFADVQPKKREYLLYLPLYNGLNKLEIGVPAGGKIEKAAPRPADRRKPLLFWGTSITHGACASRPGMVHTAILGRRFDRPVINLGFSGNGKMDEPVTALINELDPAVYIIDCLPNMPADLVAERTEPLVTTLRQSHPQTPILLVEDRNYADAWFVPSKRERNVTSQAALKAAYERLKAAGVKHLYYLEGDKLLGRDDEGTVDSSHPNDLGFWRQAEAMEQVLREIVGR